MLALAAISLTVALATGGPPPSPEDYLAGYLNHTRLGEYQAFGLLPARWETPYARDRRGVPLVDYSFGRAYNPTTTAQYGLANWTLGIRYRSNRRIRVALRMADWLVRTQDLPSGRWLYDFELNAPGSGRLARPWPSALAQGQAISLLRRAYHRTGRRVYLGAARLGVRPFRTSVARRGVLRRFRRLPFFEEYPTREAPNYVLNGFLQGLLGLHDMSDQSPSARRLFRRGLDTLPQILPLYDLGAGRSSYSLAHLHWPTPPIPAPPGYHLAHVGLLRLLDRIRPNPVLRRYVRLWSTGLAFH